MGRFTTAIAMASLVVGSLAATAVAQQQQQGQQEAQQRRDGESRLSRGLPQGTAKASDIIGGNVEDQQGRRAGEIRELLIERDGNQVAYLVLEPQAAWLAGLPGDAPAGQPGARLGAPQGAAQPGPDPTAAGPGAQQHPPAGVQGDQRVAGPGVQRSPATVPEAARDQLYVMPWRMLTQRDDQLVLAVDRNQLQQAPSFSRDEWPDLRNTGWFGGVDKFYTQLPAQGQAQAAEAQQGQNGKSYVRASEFLKREVRNPQNERLGNVEDIVLDMNSGRIAYAVLAEGGFLGLGQSLFAIPYGEFSAVEGNEFLVLAADRERLRNADGFDRNNWPATASRAWTQGGQQPDTPQPERQQQEGQQGRS